MVELTPREKVEWLRYYQSLELPVIHSFKKQETYWLDGLINEGLIDAHVTRAAITNNPNQIMAFFQVKRLTQKGLEFIADFEGDRNFAGIWKKYGWKVLIWLLVAVAGLFMAYLKGLI